MRVSLVAAALALLLTQAACERSLTERMALGGLVGAVTGEVVSEQPLEGALVGAAAGAVIEP